MIAMIVIKTYFNDDWEELIVDGKVVLADHCLEVPEVLHALGIEFEHQAIGDDNDES